MSIRPIAEKADHGSPSDPVERPDHSNAEMNAHQTSGEAAQQAKAKQTPAPQAAESSRGSIVNDMA